MTTTAIKHNEYQADPEIAKRFAYFVKTYLKDHSQRAIAERLGVSQPVISRMMNGKQSIGFATTKSLVKEFNMNARWLAEGKPSEHPISKPAPDSPTLMGQGIQELRKEVIDLKATISQMERAISIMEANQTFFIKRMELHNAQQQERIESLMKELESAKR